MTLLADSLLGIFCCQFVAIFTDRWEISIGSPIFVFLNATQALGDHAAFQASFICWFFS